MKTVVVALAVLAALVALAPELRRPRFAHLRKIFSPALLSLLAYILLIAGLVYFAWSPRWVKPATTPPEMDRWMKSYAVATHGFAMLAAIGPLIAILVFVGIIKCFAQRKEKIGVPMWMAIHSMPLTLFLWAWRLDSVLSAGPAGGLGLELIWASIFSLPAFAAGVVHFISFPTRAAWTGRSALQGAAAAAAVFGALSAFAYC
jgi:hypothetical protein